MGRRGHSALSPLPRAKPLDKNLYITALSLPSGTVPLAPRAPGHSSPCLRLQTGALGRLDCGLWAGDSSPDLLIRVKSSGRLQSWCAGNLRALPGPEPSCRALHAKARCPDQGVLRTSGRIWGCNAHRSCLYHLCGATHGGPVCSGAMRPHACHQPPRHATRSALPPHVLLCRTA